VHALRSRSTGLEISLNLRLTITCAADSVVVDHRFDFRLCICFPWLLIAFSEIDETEPDMPKGLSLLESFFCMNGMTRRSALRGVWEDNETQTAWH